LHVHCYLHTGSKSQKWILHTAPEKIMPDENNYAQSTKQHFSCCVTTVTMEKISWF
jgi:hypothetical protein